MTGVSTGLARGIQNMLTSQCAPTTASTHAASRRCSVLPTNPHKLPRRVRWLRAIDQVYGVSYVAGRLVNLM